MSVIAIVGKTRFSPATVRMMGTVGAAVNFQEGSQLLRNWPASALMPVRVESGTDLLVPGWRPVRVGGRRSCIIDPL